MLSQDQKEIAAQLTKFVVENGRVTSEHGDWNESLRGEVEFEADAQDIEDAAEIAEYAVEQFGE